MVIEAIVLGLIIGKLRSGNISSLEHIKFKGTKALLALFIFDLLLRFFIVKTNNNLASILFSYYPFFNLLVYFLVIIILEINKNLKYLRIVQGGFVLNFLPMLLNNGKMPVLKEALEKINKFDQIEILLKDSVLTHSLINDTTRFKALADIFPLNFFIPKVISLGDVFIALGLALFISHYMTGGRSFAK
ncbi:MAG: DUF5317 domain-containing protein [Bacillota bacterium]|nr:DUF5317 domain-containing protein [Bacillota bacterium]